MKETCIGLIRLIGDLTYSVPLTKRDRLEQLVDIVERVATDHIVQRAEIRRQGIRINSGRTRRGKTGGIEKNIVADTMKVT
jgi:hypothetical protein